LTNKENEKKKALKTTKGKREKLSLYPLSLDEALANILTVKPDEVSPKKKRKIIRKPK